MSSLETIGVFIITFTTLFVSILSQYQYCYNASQCVGIEWTLTNQPIYGYGYKNLAGSNTSISSDGYVYCRGAFACEQISFILADNVWCLGSYSCANIAGLSYIKAHYVTCGGSNACQDSNITSNTKINCIGDQSCIHSNITSPKISAPGSYSLYGSIIYSNKVYFSGYQSGFGATVKCKSGETCNVYCFYNGCEMLYLDCEQNSNCNIILNNNNPNITIPPIQNLAEYNDHLYDSKYNSNTLTITNNQLCNGNSQFVYDNYNQRTEPIDMNQQNGGPVCCRGGDSCGNAGSIAFTATTSDSLVCSGGDSCYGTIVNTTNTVFCQGSDSCRTTTINRAENIYCLGGSACIHSVIRESTNVYCSGSYACAGSKIESNGHDINIYLLGSQSGFTMDIYCDIGDKCEITCGAFLSCLRNTLHCNNNCIVYCNTDTSCPNGNYTIMASLSPTSNPTQNTNNPNNNVQSQNFFVVIIVPISIVSVMGW